MPIPGADENEDLERDNEDEERGTTIDLDEGGDDAGDEGGEEPAAAARTEDGKKPPKTRRDKKADRGRLRDEHERTTRENQELKERMARLEGVIAHGAGTTRRAADDAADRDDPAQRELNEIYDSQMHLQMQVEALGNKITKDQVDHFTKEARKLDQRKGELLAERVQRRNAPQQGQLEHQANLQAMRMQFPEVYSHPAALRWSRGRYEQLVARDPQLEGLDGIKKALDEARQEFGLRRDPPTENQRSRYAGVSRGGGAAPAGGAPTKITLTKAQMKMADAAYGHIKDKSARYKAWAQKAGRRLAESGRGGRRAE